MLEALASQQWKDRDWQLSFIGVSGFGEAYLRKLLTFFNIDNKRIFVIAHTENVFEEIIKNDVLLMPSMAEGTPFAMIESMACGRPALGTPVGGIPELIKNGHTGWLCRTTSIADISEKMEEVWWDRNKWADYGRNAQQFIEEKYNQETSFPELLQAMLTDINS